MQEREVSLRDIFILLLKKVKFIAVVTLVVAVICGGLGVMRSGALSGSQEEKSEISIEDATSSYDAPDSGKVYTNNLVFYIESPLAKTDYDNTNTLMNAYLNVWNYDGGLQEEASRIAQIPAHEEGDTEEESVYGITVNCGSGMVAISVVSPTDTAEDAALYIKDKLYEVVSAGVGEHSISMLANWTGEDEALEEVVEQIAEEEVSESPSVAKAFVKYFVVGLAAGFVLACGWVFMSALMAGKFFSAKDLKESLNVPALGIVTEDASAGIIRKLEGTAGISPEQSLNMASEAVKAAIAALQEKSESAEGLRAAAVSISAPEMAEKLALACGIKSLGNIIADPAALAALKDTDAVILAEDSSVIRAAALDDEFAAIRSAGKTIAGVVVK